MLTGTLTTACGVVLAGLILLAADTLVWQVRAIWRNVRQRRQFLATTDRFIARVRADQERTREQIAEMRRTAEAHGVHLPPGGDRTKGV